MQTISGNFEWAVRALAQKADTQIGLFPSFTVEADELALDFEEWFDAFLKSDEGLSMTAKQRELLSALDKQLLSMSGPENEELWTEEALRTSSEWDTVRKKAIKYLESMEWSLDAPPSERSLYVGGDS